MTETDGKRRLPTDDWEQIYIRPSIDLISDEYERKTNSNLLVELVRDPDDTDALRFLKLMEQLGYQISETDLEDMEQQAPPSEWLDGVVKKVKSQRCDGVIMVFSQITCSKKVMKDVWTKFNSKECPELKNKPKIFIFLMAPPPKTLLQADVSPFSPKWAAAYETPSEADMLIILDKFVEDGVNFLFELTNYIENYGDKEDILTLASVSPNSPPLLISTMTRKFYVKLHQHRGQHLDIYNGADHLEKKLEEMHQQLCGAAATSEVDGPKRTKSLFSSLRKTFSRNFKKRPVAEQGESSKKDGSGKKGSSAASKDELEDAKTSG